MDFHELLVRKVHVFHRFGLRLAHFGFGSRIESRHGQPVDRSFRNGKPLEQRLVIRCEPYRFRLQFALFGCERFDFRCGFRIELFSGERVVPERLYGFSSFGFRLKRIVVSGFVPF